MTKNSIKSTSPKRARKTSARPVPALIKDLSNTDGLVRVKARKALVSTGGPAVALLVKALGSKKQWVRWEAAKTLGQIGDAKATTALIKALEDKNFDVRWLAAEGLHAIGREAIVPILQALKKRPGSVWLREGAHHVLHSMDGGHYNKTLNPVLLAMESFEPAVETPLAVLKALRLLTKEKTPRSAGNVQRR